MSRLCLSVLALGLTAGIYAQTTIATGSIQGTVIDPAGAVVPGAKVTVTGKSTGQIIHATTGNAGSYNSGALIPGQYQVKVAAPASGPRN